MSISDQLLIDELQQNSRSAFESIYRRYFHQLFLFVCEIVIDKEIAREIAQESMVKLWEMRTRLNREAGIRSLLFTIGRNISLNYIKSYSINRKNHEIYQEKAAIMQQNYEALNDEAAQRLFSDEIEKIVNETLEQLPPKTKEIFMMSRFQGLTYHDIAIKQNLSLKSVEYHISEALKALRQMLKDFL